MNYNIEDIHTPIAGARNPEQCLCGHDHTDGPMYFNVCVTDPEAQGPIIINEFGTHVYAADGQNGGYQYVSSATRAADHYFPGVELPEQDEWRIAFQAKHEKAWSDIALLSKASKAAGAPS